MALVVIWFAQNDYNNPIYNQMKNKYVIMNSYSIVWVASNVINHIVFDLCNYNGSCTTLHKINYKDNLFPSRQ